MPMHSSPPRTAARSHSHPRAQNARNAILFSFLAVGFVLAAHAQAPSQQPAPSPNPQAAPIPAGTLSVAQIDAAFVRADADRNGQISRQEAARFPAVLELFDRMDTDRNGGLSRAEFEAGLKL
jgi:hypothetical protein